MIRMMQWVTSVSLAIVFIVSTASDVASYPSSEFYARCVPGEFQCQDGQCIPLLFRCDMSHAHCAGGEDEQGCPCGFHCQSGRYLWWSESRDTINSCIKAASVCNGFKDCWDGEDEADCECPFRCDAVHPYKLQGRSDRTTGCLPLSDVCDGLMYCIDGLDEQNCPCDFQCNSASGDQKCIQQRDVCNYSKDCDGGEDEQNCPCEYKCRKGVHPYYYGYKHTSNSCIRMADVCDKFPGCVDGQDEVGCNY